MELEGDIPKDHRRYSEQMSLQPGEYVKKKSVFKYKVICAVLLCALVAVSLGLGLGLGLKKEQVSCRHKCNEPHRNGVPGCQCDSGCKERQDCCWDYEDTCVEPTRSWKCTNFRCGETRIPGSYCSCSDDCLQKKDCCVNYYSVCRDLLAHHLSFFQWMGLEQNICKLGVPCCQILKNSGLYPESHGIIDNNMYDVHLNAHFSLSGEEKFKPAWWKGQPVWLTAMYQNLTAGTFFWPGSDVPIEGTYPTLYTIYNGSVPYEKRISGILKWLDNAQPERPHLYTLYIEEPDSSGHSFGPVSAGVIKALQAADQALGMLMDGLKQRNLHKCVNLIVLADHGMEKTYCKQLEYMTNYFKTVDFYMYAGPAARIRARNVPKDYFTFDSEGIVKNLTCRRSPQHFKPYLTPDLPKRFHYANNIRIDKVHLLVDRQWLAVRDASYTYCDGGNHGYDNEFKSMEAIFLAYGPSFKEKTEVDAFENIEVYNLMCDLLQIVPAQNNGTHGSLNHLLKKPFYNPSHPREVSSPYSCPVSNLAPADDLGCNCTQISNASQEVLLNKRLNLTAEEINKASSSHLPYGRPKVLQKENVYCLLSHRQYVSGYSYDIWMPLWTAYTVDKPENTSPLPPTVSDCLRPDVRIPVAWSQNCSDYPEGLTLTHSFLYPPNYSSSDLEQYDALLTSNIVPMYKAFKDIWDYFHNVLLQKYARERNGVNVISGPVFDYNYDGHFDSPDEIKQYVNNTKIPVPTHYYVVLTSCKNTSYTPLNCSGSLDALSFIIPHRPDNTESCAENKTLSEWVEERVQAHSARVRDVELLTGLDFYQERNEPISEILRLKTFLPIFETESN
ncbi:PREDICTED: ectonucleotide pyrophosphatase/phosphodiesterase family member 3 isoform X2 [Corvus brachyrhynchos]|uniref:ectonucleotide pyrophosphatase/phosphodiesterase family member 3 isoform X2 n=1 Tax=Corvus brachyrhynchos TaxID=85066 RepID=UPI0008165077|nr:PREDICTED: ectonucleotide pyrophosphatase/phosphodiesterase family member 3 isoform X2 [Corvus brachyrhynchos]